MGPLSGTVRVVTFQGGLRSSKTQPGVSHTEQAPAHRHWRRVGAGSRCILGWGRAGRKHDVGIGVWGGGRFLRRARGGLLCRGRRCAGLDSGAVVVATIGEVEGSGLFGLSQVHRCGAASTAGTAGRTVGTARRPRRHMGCTLLPARGMHAPADTLAAGAAHPLGPGLQ